MAYVAQLVVVVGVQKLPMQSEKSVQKRDCGGYGRVYKDARESDKQEKI